MTTETAYLSSPSPQSEKTRRLSRQRAIGEALDLAALVFFLLAIFMVRS
jgi:hypothetical protein